MNGINKTVNLQKKVTITTDDLKEVDLAFLNLKWKKKLLHTDGIYFN